MSVWISDYHTGSGHSVSVWISDYHTGSGHSVFVWITDCCITGSWHSLCGLVIIIRVANIQCLCGLVSVAARGVGTLC